MWAGNQNISRKRLKRTKLLPAEGIGFPLSSVDVAAVDHNQRLPFNLIGAN
jgi:hypothetical protein